MALWQWRRPPDTAQHPLLLGPLVPTHKCLSGLPCPLKPLLPDHSPAGQQWASDRTWVDVSLPQDSSEMGADHGPLSHGRSCESSERILPTSFHGRVLDSAKKLGKICGRRQCGFRGEWLCVGCTSLRLGFWVSAL